LSIASESACKCYATLSPSMLEMVRTSPSAARRSRSLKYRSQYCAPLGAFIPGEGFESSRIVNGDQMILERQKSAFAQLAQDPVHMYGAEPESIAENNLTQRTSELVAVGQSDQLQTVMKFQKEMSRPLDGAAATDAYQVFDDHRFVPRGSPKDRRPEARKLAEYLPHAESVHPRDDGVGQGGKRVIRGAQQHAAQPDEVTGQREGDDLSSSIRQNFETACPTHVKDVGDFACLPLVHEFFAGRHANSRRLKLREIGQFAVGKTNEGADLFRQDARIVPHGFGLSGALRHTGAPS